MRIKGPRQSILGLFGGPLFLVALSLAALVAIGIAYLAATGHEPRGTGASLAIPGAAAPSGASSPQTEDLVSMAAAPAPKELPLRVVIEEDLSPADLLARFPPDATESLTPGADELPAWRRFGRPSATPLEARRLALVITGLGPDRATIVRLITGTPPEVSLSFDPTTPELGLWVTTARAYGHEVLLDLSLQDDDERDLDRIDALLTQVSMIAGVTIGDTGSLLGDATELQSIMALLRARGLAAIGLSITAPLVLGADVTARDAATIEKVLSDGSAVAKRRGAAVVLASAPSASPLLNGWFHALSEQGQISLVPVTALIRD